MKVELNNRSDLRRLRTMLNEQLEDLGNDIDLAFQVGDIRFESDGSSAVIKLSCNRVNSDGSVEDPSVNEFKKSIWMWPGIEEDDLNRTFVSRRCAYKITGANPRATKYPILCKRVSDGATFKFPPSTIVRALGREAA